MQSATAGSLGQRPCPPGLPSQLRDLRATRCAKPAPQALPWARTQRSTTSSFLGKQSKVPPPFRLWEGRNVLPPGCSLPVLVQAWQKAALPARSHRAQAQHREGLMFAQECPGLSFPTATLPYGSKQGKAFPGPKRQGVIL